MTHKQLVAECKKNGLKVEQVPAQDRRSYNATRPDGLRVYWSTSYEGGMLGAARIVYKGADTHAINAASISYYAKL
jgi:hypothetical protein